MSEGERRLVPVLAALQPRSEPDRNGILQTQGPYARRKGQNLRRAPEGHRRYLRPLRARRMLELFQCRRLCVRLNARCFSQLSPLEQPCFVWGASCLPKDEYETWVSNVKPLFAFPTGALFLKWAQQEREHLIGKLDASTDDHQD